MEKEITVGPEDFRITIVTSDKLIDTLKDMKEEAEKDLLKFCREKAVELFAGYSVEEGYIKNAHYITEKLEVLKFLLGLHNDFGVNVQ